MKNRKYIVIVIAFVIIQNVLSQPLDIIAGKSGEEQVKDALDKAEKESEQAAKEKTKVSTTKDKDENTSVLSLIGNDIDNAKSDKSTRSSTDLKETLDKKVEELAKFHEKHKTADAVHSDLKDLKLKELAELSKNDEKTDSALTEMKSAESKEKENAVLEEESDKKMVEMAKKLNNLVVKFQKKMGRLSHRPKNAEELLPHKEPDDNGESTVKSIRGKPATHAPIDLSSLMANLHPKSASRPAIDMAGLRNALGLLHTKSPSKTADDSNGKTSYKEDTKLEDRLAMEAEEEKKFSNGDNYEDGGESDATSKSTSSSASSTATSSLSPKEQASQEMQNYNALISSESNRELSQIQEEISKATQSSMGQVSVVGQKENVNTEAPPSLPGIPGLNDAGLAGLGGLGALGGGSLDAGALGAAGGIGGSSAEQFQGLQSGGTEGLEAAAAAAGAPSSSVNSYNEAGGAPASGQISLGSQSPIEIGGSQTPVEMGTMSAGVNPFQASQSNPFQSLQGDQQQQSFMTQAGQSPMELGSQQSSGGQSTAFKKSKISKRSKKIHKGHSHHKRKRLQHEV